jgi:hypothetical protein
MLSLTGALEPGDHKFRNTQSVRGKGVIIVNGQRPVFSGPKFFHCSIELRALELRGCLVLRACHDQCGTIGKVGSKGTEIQCVLPCDGFSNEGIC